MTRQPYGCSVVGACLAVVLTSVLVGCSVQRQVRIETLPPGAQVYLDGEKIGTTPLETTIQLSENKGADPTSIRAIAFEGPVGYRRIVKMITAEELEDAKGVNVLRYDLEPVPKRKREEE